MKSFLQLRQQTMTLLESEANLHMTHLEDALLYRGGEGISNMIKALDSLVLMLSGHASAKDKIGTTTKLDGAPAVFVGLDPADGKFFVAKKGLFNKEPKLYKTSAEIDADTSGDLAVKLKIALEELSKLGITDILQGDLMYTYDTLKVETIEGVKYVLFHPNTIVYAVPIDSPLGKKIMNSRIGVAFHTKYTGDSIDKLKASFGEDFSYLKDVPSVVKFDVNVPNFTGTLFDTEESAHVSDLLDYCEDLYNEIPVSIFDKLKNNKAEAQLIETYGNSLIRKNVVIHNASDRAAGFIAWLSERNAKSLEDKKSAAGRDKELQRQAAQEEFFSDILKFLPAIFEMQNNLVVLKGIILDKLNTLNSTSTFIKTNDGYRVTNAEGFVLLDKIKGGALKLVDRLEFSKSNFDPSIIKGWQK